MDDLSKLLNFANLMSSFRAIKRDIPKYHNVEPENDAEHSYQLAMMCWYITTIENLNLDINKILKYALVHDLAEVYAGDVSLYTSNDAQRDVKKR